MDVDLSRSGTCVVCGLPVQAHFDAKNRTRSCEETRDQVPAGTYILGTNIPYACSAHDLARIFDVGVQQIDRRALTGEFDFFKLIPSIGPKRWSGLLLKRWLDGEIPDQVQLERGLRPPKASKLRIVKAHLRQAE